jgi:4-amino-4-deoxy-L-arabinose transferase-like glycosyltransferase
MRHARLLLVGLCLLFYLPGQTQLPPGDRDESRFAQATKQMIQSGDYVRIMNGKAARNRKPVGIYWLQAPFALAARALEGPASNPIWPYRLPSLLGAIAAVLATFETALALTADRRAALLAGGMFASCVLLTVEAHIAKTDAALLGATSWAMAMLARAWMGKTLVAAEAAVFWLALGLGILIKGPIAPMVAGLCTLMLILWRPVPGWRWLRALRPAWGIPLMALVVLPWFIAIQLATHGAFLAQSVGGDLASKVAGGSETHGGLPGEHLLLLPLLAFPSSLAVIAALPGAWAARHAPATRFLLAWIIPSWLVFELAPTKLPHYTLPLYPALFMLAASCHLGSVPGVNAKILSALSRVGLWIAAALLGLGGLALAIALNGPWWLALPALPTAGAAAWFAQKHKPWLAIACAAPLYATILQITLPHIGALWVAPRVEAALHRDWPGRNARGQGLAVSGYAEPSLVFETGKDTRLLPDGPAAADALAHGDASMVLIERRAEAGFLAAVARRHMTVQRVDEVAGFNISRGRSVDLIFYRQAAPS